MKGKFYMPEEIIERDPNELIQYFIVNKDLNMSIGKVAAQVSHGAMLIALRDQNEEKFKKWLSIAIKKVVLVGNETKLIKLHEQLPSTILIIDNGHTEVPPQSKTVLAFPIMTREEAKQYIGRLRLL
jgi:peptidyl-tRNA hydrolase